MPVVIFFGCLDFGKIAILGQSPGIVPVREFKNSTKELP